MTNALHSSESCEHITPPEEVERARELLGGIDFDPCSHPTANAIVGAAQFIALPRNGLRARWRGRCLVNPPGGCIDAAGMPVPKGVRGVRGKRSATRAWWGATVQRWLKGQISSVLFVVFNFEHFQRCQLGDEARGVHPLDFPASFPRERVCYWHVGEGGMLVRGEQPTHATALVYLPPFGEAEACDRMEWIYGGQGHVHLPRRSLWLGEHGSRSRRVL